MNKLSATLLLLVSVLSLHAQQFDRPNLAIPVIQGNDTLQYPWTGGLNGALISEIDIDLNGTQDLFLYDRSNDRISVYRNDGSTTGNPYHYDYFSPSKFPTPNAWALLYDYDTDGRADYFTMSPCNCGIAIYRNISTPNNLEFTLITNMLEELDWPNTINVYANSLAVPAFDDIDSDGDMDILGFNVLPNGRIIYHKNYSMENWGIGDSLNFKYELNRWGYFQLKQGGTNSVNCYFCRTTEPGSQNPVVYDDPIDYYNQSVAAPRDDTNMSLLAIDLDGDVDKELLIGDITATNTLMVCNGGTPAVALMDSTCEDTLFPSYDIPIRMEYFANHAYIDADNDGIRDLLVTPQHTENKHCIWLYKNTGTNSIPVFDFIRDDFLVDDMVDVGEGASPVFFDQNNDGLQDLVIGNYSEYNSTTSSYRQNLSLYRNTGTVSQPEFTLVTTNFANISSMGLDGVVYPAFGDLTGDGTMDMILGSGNGMIHYFIGSGNPINFTLAQANFCNIDVGDASTPALADLNGDGKLDLVIGEKSGFLNYYGNIGTTTSPNYPATPHSTPFGGINVQTPGYVDGYSVPFIYEKNGLYNMWVSCAMGDVYEYLDLFANLSGTMPLNDTLIHGNQGIRLNYNIAASGAHLDGDSDIDMALGIYSGGVQFYTSINPSGLPDPIKPEAFNFYPNPAQETVTLTTLPFVKLPVQLELFNSLGQQVQSVLMTTQTQTMDVSQFPEGMYLLRMKTEKGAYTKKLIVQD